MGNSASKRTLPTAARAAQQVKKSGGVNVGQNSAQNAHRNGASDQIGTEKDEYETVSERLLKLGTVQFEELSKVPYNQKNALLNAVKARQKLQQQKADAPPASKLGPKDTVPAPTLSSILQSRSEGDSLERIATDYSVTLEMLEKVGTRFSIPKRPLPERRANKSAGQDDVSQDFNVRALNRPLYKEKPDFDEIRPKKKTKDVTVEL